MTDVTSTDGSRPHEMRIAVLCVEPPDDSTESGRLLSGALGTWRVDPLFVPAGPAEQAESWLITALVPERVGTPEYARRAHTLVQGLIESPGIRAAEADIPVRAYLGDARHAAPDDGDNSPPGSEAIRWARDAMRCSEAWALPSAPGGTSRGGGIVVGHPDTGYTLHPNLGVGALDLTQDRDFIADDDDARDPLVPPGLSPWPLPNPGHGTTTASVLAGRGTEAAGIVGVAPEAIVVPLRTVDSVVQLFDSDVARSVDYARGRGCHLVSISLGGKGFFGLREAIQRAVDAGIIVIGAAGNNVGIVVAPASYPNCLAAAATGPDDKPWPESSSGPAVDVSTPGWGVHVAHISWRNERPIFDVQQTSGSSYAAAHLAGVAALWLAHHGAAALRERYGAGLQDVFLQLLRSGGCRVPVGWDAANWGAGVVDAAALLNLPLPSAPDKRHRPVHPAEPPISRISALVGIHEGELERLLRRRLGLPDEQLHRTLARFEGELVFHLAQDRAFRGFLLGSGTGDPACESNTTGAASSPQFAAVFLSLPPDGVRHDPAARPRPGLA